MVECPNCHAPNAPSARFCNQCGTSLVPTRPPTSSLAGEAERRVVTVLFADVAGSTALAHDLDPEIWSEIMAGAFGRFTEPIERFGGTVARLMGDAVLAFFGAPEAHEDDPRRAVLAGLAIVEGMDGYRMELRQRQNLDLQVRVGINTGLVVVGEIGSNVKMEYSAMGDAVNLAARMEQTAEPGTVRITEDTYRRVAPMFDVESLGPLEVKGRPAPVAAYRVLRERTRPGSERGIEGLSAPLVGRDRELGLLNAAVDELRLGRGQIISVIGEAGLGKSRLLQELQRGFEHAHAAAAEPGGERAAAGVPQVAWHEGRSYSYQTAIPYAPVADLLRSMLGLDRPGELVAFERVRRSVADVAPELVEHEAPLLAWVVGLDAPEIVDELRFMEPDEVQGRTFHAVRAFVEATARSVPTVLVFEDLHWADAVSLNLLEALLPVADRASLMLLAAFRPQRGEPSWKFHELAQREFGHRYVHVALAPLDEAASRRLVAHLLHVEDLPQGVRETILAKAEGNPFYVEEVIRELLDAGHIERRDGRWMATGAIEEIRVPDTLAGLLTTRIDRLDAGAKRVLQTASVIGREFELAALEDVHEEPDDLAESLATLERRELVRLRARFPKPSYQFKHVLIQETTYGSMLLSRRRELHHRVAACLERIAPHRVEDIARHWLAAEEPAEALPWIVQAGAKALGAFASHDARRWFERARELLDDRADPGLARRVFEGLGTSLEYVGDAAGALQAYEALHELGIESSDVPTRVSALNKRAAVVGFHLGRLDEAMELLERADRLSEGQGSLAESVETSMVRCTACAFTGKFGEAIHALGGAVETSAALGLDDARAHALAHLASTHVFKAAFDEAEPHIAESLAHSERVGDLYHLADIRGFALPHLRLVQGDLPGALAAAESALDASREIGVPFLETNTLLTLARLRHLRGDLGLAMQSSREGIVAARASGPRGGIPLPWLISGLWRAALDAGDAEYETARAAHAEALAPLLPRAGTPTWADLGEIALMRGDFDEAERWFERALEEPGPYWLLHRPRAWLGLGDAALRRGRLDAPCLAQARSFIEQHGLWHYLPELLLLEGDLAMRTRGADAAAAGYDAAAGEAERRGFRLIHARALTRQAEALRALGRTGDAEALDAQADAMRRAVDDGGGARRTATRPS